MEIIQSKEQKEKSSKKIRSEDLISDLRSEMAQSCICVMEAVDGD